MKTIYAILMFVMIFIWGVQSYKIHTLELMLGRMDCQLTVIQQNVDTVDNFLNEKISKLETKLAPELTR